MSRHSSTVPQWLIWLLVVGGFVILLCGVLGWWVAREVRREMVVWEHDMTLPDFDHLLNVGSEAMPIWDDEGLAIKYKFTAENKPIERFELRTATIDNCLPQPALPYVIENMVVGKPYWLTLRYPGFAGRGEKLAPLEFSYSTSDRSVTKRGPSNIRIPLRPDKKSRK